MKKLLATSLVLLSVATLAACSGNKSSETAGKETTVAETTTASKTESSNASTSDFTLLTDEEIDNAKSIGDMKTLYGKLIDSYKKYVEEIGNKLPADQKETYTEQVEPALEAMEDSRKAFNDGLSAAGSDDTAMPEQARTIFLQQLKTARDVMKKALESANQAISAQ
jgi:putative lipoprotein